MNDEPEYNEYMNELYQEYVLNDVDYDFQMDTTDYREDYYR